MRWAVAPQERHLRLAGVGVPILEVKHFWFKGSTMVQLWFNYDSTMVQLWFNYGSTMVQLWFNYGSTMIQLWFNYGSTMVQLWFNYGSTMIQLWFNYDSTMVQLWFNYGSTMIQLWFNYCMFNFPCLIQFLQLLQCSGSRWWRRSWKALGSSCTRPGDAVENVVATARCSAKVWPHGWDLDSETKRSQKQFIDVLFPLVGWLIEGVEGLPLEQQVNDDRWD